MNEDTGIGVEREGVGEGVGEGEGVVKDGSEVVKVEPGIEEGSVAKLVSGGVEEKVESESSEPVEVRNSGVTVEDGKSDNEIKVEGSIVMEESKEESTLLELKSGSRVTDEGISAEESIDRSGSPDVGVGVSNVPVLDGNTSVADGSSVCVGVGSELTSKEVERKGVDVGESVGVSVEKVEKVEKCRW